MSPLLANTNYADDHLKNTNETPHSPIFNPLLNSLRINDKLVESSYNDFLAMTLDTLNGPKLTLFHRLSLLYTTPIIVCLECGCNWSDKKLKFLHFVMKFQRLELFQNWCFMTS